MHLNEAPTLAFGRFRLDTVRGLLYRDGAVLAQDGRAILLLLALVRRAGEVMSHRELERAVWPHAVEASNLRAQVVRLRRMLGDDAQDQCYIANVAGRGYSFVGELERLPRA